LEKELKVVSPVKKAQSHIFTEKYDLMSLHLKKELKVVENVTQSQPFIWKNDSKSNLYLDEDLSSV